MAAWTRRPAPGGDPPLRRVGQRDGLIVFASLETELLDRHTRHTPSPSSNGSTPGTTRDGDTPPWATSAGQPWELHCVFGRGGVDRSVRTRPARAGSSAIPGFWSGARPLAPA